MRKALAFSAGGDGGGGAPELPAQFPQVFCGCRVYFEKNNHERSELNRWPAHENPARAWRPKDVAQAGSREPSQETFSGKKGGFD